MRFFLVYQLPGLFKCAADSGVVVGQHPRSRKKMLFVFSVKERERERERERRKMSLLTDQIAISLSLHENKKWVFKLPHFLDLTFGWKEVSL